MYQKYFAYQTAFLVVFALVLEVLPVEPVHISSADFTTIVGKFLSIIVGVFIVLPVVAHFFSMWWNSLRNTKFIWFLLMMFLGPFASVPYYFIVYRGNSTI